METQTPLISFIVPYHNEPFTFLKTCLDSILACQLDAWTREVIVVDDGSDISPAPWIDENYGTWVKTLRQPQGGQSTARNAGMDVATGTYIQFVDADDRLEPEVYNLCIDTIRQYSADMVCFGHRMVLDGQQVSAKARRRVKLYNCYSGANLMAYYNIQGASWWFVFRRAACGDLRFTPGIIHEDEEFTARLLLRVQSVFYLRGEAYVYTRRAHSTITSTHSEQVERRMNCKFYVINSLADTLPTLQDDLQRKALQRRIDQMSMDYMVDALRTHVPGMAGKAVANLRMIGLFPLRPKKYTMTYFAFALLTRSKICRKLLEKWSMGNCHLSIIL